ncbi:MAG TPA: DUF4157 domain-containing protein [Rhizomicrobium sp.]|nr:DUF4157 domain-containing protein [Rhizomicrobium sp.]
MPLRAIPAGVLQRKCACGTHTPGGGICSACAGKTGELHRQGAGPDAAPPLVHDVLRAPGHELDARTRDFFEPRFGRDFSGVRVHTGEAATQSAQAVGARAYTVGRDVVFAKGQYAPHSAEGQHLLAHELSHTIQQAGATAPTSSLRIGETSTAAEHESSAAADTVMQGGVADVASHAQGVIQREAFKGDGPGPGHPLPWTPNRTLPAGSFAVSMTAGVAGESGTITFNPDVKNCPTCKAIRLVQVVRVSDSSSQEYHWPAGDTEAPREKVKTAEDKDKGIKGGYFVDHYAAKCSKGNKCSIYYRDHAPNATKSQDGSNDGTTAVKASLWDGPSGPAGYLFEFETCARCADDGSVLRCLDWGFTSDAAGKVTPSANSEHADASATFGAAVGAFNKFYANP